MNPLTLWRCDVCTQPVSAENGYVLWGRRPRTGTGVEGNGYASGGYIIIHQGRCDPRTRDYQASAPLTDFLGPEGQTRLTSMLAGGRAHDGNWETEQADLAEFVDFFRRVQLPWYEQARPHFTMPEVRERFRDTDPAWVYVPETLRGIAEEFGTS